MAVIPRSARPVKGTPRVSRGRRLPKFVEGAEWPKLLAAAGVDRAGKPRSPGVLERNRGLVAVMLYAGLRVGEVCALNLTDLVLDQGAEQVVVRHGKGDKERRVDLHRKAVAYLQAYLAVRPPSMEPGEDGITVDPLWVRYDQPTPARLGRRAVQRLSVEVGFACGYPWLTAHKFRHSFATELYEKSGGDLILTMHTLGHEDPTTTAIYAHAKDPKRRAAIDRL